MNTYELEDRGRADAMSITNTSHETWTSASYNLLVQDSFVKVIELFGFHTKDCRIGIVHDLFLPNLEMFSRSESCGENTFLSHLLKKRVGWSLSVRFMLFSDTGAKERRVYPISDLLTKVYMRIGIIGCVVPYICDVLSEWNVADFTCLFEREARVLVSK